MGKNQDFTLSAADAFMAMFEDWQADNWEKFDPAETDDPLTIDGGPEYDEELQRWKIRLKDKKACYTAWADNDGFIHLDY